jgi:hypothetical protein
MNGCVGRNVAKWALIGLACAACSRHETATRFGLGSNPAKAFRPALTLSDSEAGLAVAGADAPRRFNFAFVRDLWVRVTVPRVLRVSVLELSFRAPDGQIFYQDRFPFTIDDRVRMAMVPGAASPTPAHPAHPIPGGYALDRPVAIAGSVFEKYPQRGLWRIEATVEGYPGTITTEMWVDRR